MAISHWPTSLRPREKLLTEGAKQLSDAELLALFINTGVAGKSAIDIAQNLLKKYHNLATLLATPAKELTQQPGLGTAKFALLQGALELGKRYCLAHARQMPILESDQEIRLFLGLQLRHLKKEVFACLFLNSQMKVINYEELFVGTIGQVPVYPREIAKRALELSASGVVLAHNHPSGVAKPSQSDIELTSNIKQALDIIEVKLLDHIIVAHEQQYSFAKNGGI